jgi:predicted N-acetyltransferase YhbS
VTMVIPLTQVSTEAVEKLLDDAFGTDRLSRTAYLLRTAETEIASLSFAILGDGRLVGSIQCWPVRIGQTKLVLVGPVAVAPERQGTGIGRQLMHATLEASSAIGNPAMAMIGDPEYYGRFGFTADATGGWTLPGPWEPRRLLVRNIAEHWLPLNGMLERDDAL